MKTDADQDDHARPMIAVVIVCGPRHQSMLDRALQSLQAQTVSDFETCVVGNGCIPLVDVQLPRLSVDALWSARTLGDATDYAIKRTHAPYITRLDADDWLEAEALETLGRTLGEHPELDAVYCDTLRAEFIGAAAIVEPTDERGPVLMGGAMFTRQCYETIGGFGDIHHGDSERFWLNFRNHGFRHAHIPRPLYYYRQHEAQMHHDRAG